MTKIILIAGYCLVGLIYFVLWLAFNGLKGNFFSESRGETELDLDAVIPLTILGVILSALWPLSLAITIVYFVVLGIMADVGIRGEG